jgi:DNA-binding CsgD family transcriptional regulator
MSDAARSLEALSQVVLQLHRGSREWPAASFAPRACELLGTLMDFDACLWGSVRADAPQDTRLAMDGLYCEGLSPAALAEALAGEGLPPTLSAQHVEPLAARRVELRLWRGPGVTRARTVGLVQGLALSPLDQPPLEDADDRDRQTLQFLMPHLVEAQRENRLSRAYEGEAAAPARRSHVLCDAGGVLQQVDEHGLALLRSEWPRWCAARLPDALVRAVEQAAGRESAAGVPPFHGRHVTVLITRSGPAWLLEVRRRSAVDRLSTRQRDIATLYAEGHTGPQIAVQLGLSPSTVNNHLGVIFKKLAVSNKVQLLNAMKRG